MPMSINTNVMSLNAQRNATRNEASMATTMQRLSSGLRVNTAKDDAAGLAIAERMNTQVRGMTIAVRNANDGISLSQVAESGISTLTDILQRMRELAVQSLNSTNASGDINALGQEYTQLGAELSRIISAVQFNGSPLFTTTAGYTFQVGANTGQSISVASSTLNFQSAAGLSAVMGGSTATTSALIASSNAENSAHLLSIDTAIDTVNAARAQLGAVQSRFEKTINFLETGIENQSAARGRIMDADFASETSNLSRVQILQQAGTAMIAQANQMPQSVLQLLKG
jgi:flagellin